MRTCPKCGEYLEEILGSDPDSRVYFCYNCEWHTGLSDNQAPLGDDFSAKVLVFPLCNLCSLYNMPPCEAHYNGKTRLKGQWGFMCEAHFKSHGLGLGLGLGQRLVLVRS